MNGIIQNTLRYPHKKMIAIGESNYIPWYLADGLISKDDVLLAYQGKNLCDYETSKINLANRGSYTLTESNAIYPPSFDSKYGWTNCNEQIEYLYDNSYLKTAISLNKTGEYCIVSGYAKTKNVSVDYTPYPNATKNNFLCSTWIANNAFNTVIGHSLGDYEGNIVAGFMVGGTYYPDPTDYKSIIENDTITMANNYLDSYVESTKINTFVSPIFGSDFTSFSIMLTTPQSRISWCKATVLYNRKLTEEELFCVEENIRGL